MYKRQPIKVNIRSIYCAADGFFYIGGSQKTLLRGRLNNNKEQWEVINTDTQSNTSFNNLTWFQNQLWIGSTHGIYRLENEQEDIIVKPYVFPNKGAKLFSISGNVCSCNEALMVWGDSQVLLFDGEKWEDFLKNFTKK